MFRLGNEIKSQYQVAVTEQEKPYFCVVFHLDVCKASENSKSTKSCIHAHLKTLEKEVKRLPFTLS
jgi:hypothetical protein